MVRAHFMVKLMYAMTINNAAEKLRKSAWELFVDGAGIRDAPNQQSLAYQSLRAAWEVANPISKYLAAAELAIAKDGGSE